MPPLGPLGVTSLPLGLKAHCSGTLALPGTATAQAERAAGCRPRAAQSVPAPGSTEGPCPPSTSSQPQNPPPGLYSRIGSVFRALSCFPCKGRLPNFHQEKFKSFSESYTQKLPPSPSDLQCLFCSSTTRCGHREPTGYLSPWWP